MYPIFSIVRFLTLLVAVLGLSVWGTSEGHGFGLGH